MVPITIKEIETTRIFNQKNIPTGRIFLFFKTIVIKKYIHKEKSETN